MWDLKVELYIYLFSLINLTFERPLMCCRWREETTHSKNNSFGGGRSCSFRVCGCLFVGFEICYEEEE